MTKLVIVESPTKAKTIRNYLPTAYQVKASMGHVRDLPASASEVPASIKGESWARLGVNVQNDFEPCYVVPRDKKKTVSELKSILKEADELILATDEDREGESIGWHLIELLKPKVPVRRMVFHEITREAIQTALDDTRDLDQNLVRAQETRRILDRLVGYTVSPLLWKKIAPKLSAGRVQSAAVRLLVLRERERRAFRSGAYWDLKAHLNKRPDEPKHRFEAQLHSVGGKRVASGRDFDESTGKIAEGRDVLLLNQDEAETLRNRLLDGEWRVTGIDTREATRSPAPPFTTSTLQQEANRKLGMGARETMRVAQRLYENGYITYMRTDSVNLSDQAIQAARQRVIELYGQEYLNPTERRYKTKSQAAQEAHEAIRPAGDQMLPADRLPISGQEHKLYDLIWKRTVATQMANAQLRFTTATIQVHDAIFRASGRNVLFAGFFRAYVEGSDDPEAALENQEAPLPDLTVDEIVDCRELEAVGHETKPPARYTEASLVKALEAEGIGRPSTYASIIDTIQNRGYTFKIRRELVPTFTAFGVTQLLEEHFHDLVDMNFTAKMEADLDKIATGDLAWLAYLRAFYLGESGLENQVNSKQATIDPRIVSGVGLEDFPYEVRIGQFGPFLAKEVEGERVTAGLPPDLPPADLTKEMADELFEQKSDGPKNLGADPETGLTIVLKAGPYGPYVQLGNDEEMGKKKPKRASLLKNMDANMVDLDLALRLLSLPRSLGDHPESGKAVQAGVGRFGPYVVHDGVYASLKAPDDVLTVELPRALELLSEAATEKRGGSKKVLKELGEHPDEGGPIQVLDGRYGPYVKHKRVNATIPKGTEPESVTLEQALVWIAEKKEKKGTKSKSRRKKAK
ncbi:type I DNA topoisomerase [Chloroflexi bacterium TSY]|nr:type I DNA topoisomerase [Chloroflexi bacterium TSY]